MSNYNWEFSTTTGGDYIADASVFSSSAIDYNYVTVESNPALSKFPVGIEFQASLFAEELWVPGSLRAYRANLTSGANTTSGVNWTGTTTTMTTSMSAEWRLPQPPCKRQISLFTDPFTDVPF